MATGLNIPYVLGTPTPPLATVTEFVPDAHTAAFVRAIAPRYVIERELARGGMSRVYLAQDVRHNRHVAVKVLPPDLATAISTQRFLREIEIAAQLTHPNILPLHDSGEAAGRLYYVMPYVDGPTLKQVVGDRAPYPVEEAIDVACKIADALDYAHGRGVVHCDIKPANILFVAGQPVLSDFGIALVRQAVSEPMLAEQAMGGTVSYMSPEQRGLAQSQIDPRADIFALGIVLHEMLTGLLPVQDALDHGRDSRLARRRAHSEAPAIPRRVGAVIRRATAPRPSDRFATAAEFAHAMRAAKNRGPTPRRIIGAAALLVISVGAWRTLRRESHADPPLRPKRVVVAPFESPSRDAALDYLGVMAADWITVGLQATGLVDVIATPTALQSWSYAKSQRGADPVRTLAEETDAGIVVTGAAYRVGDSLHLQIQVSDVAGRRLLGAFESTHGALSSVMPVMEDARSRVMGLLSTTLDSRVASALTVPTHPPTFEAYREFSAGLQAYVAGDFHTAQSRFSAAFDRDTTFATALLMGSISASNNISYATADSLLDRLAAHRSELTPVDRLWFDYRRALLRGKPSESLAAIRELAAMTPGTKATYNLGIEALQDGYLAEAERAFDGLRPDRGPMRGWVAYWDAVSRVRHLRGEHARELAESRRAREMYPDRRYALLASMRVLGALNRPKDIEALLDRADSLPGDPIGTTPADLGFDASTELHAHGNTEAARAIARRSLSWLSQRATKPPTFSERWLFIRLLYAAGDWKRAADSAAALAETFPKRADVLGLLGAAAARSGDSTTAERANRVLQAMPHDHDLGLVVLSQARIAATLGQRDSAVARLRRTFDEAHEFDLWVHRDPDFLSLRGYPPFDAVMRPHEP
jgi:TolB-like protein